MEQAPIVYDSITGGALRMARRHWYVIAAAAVLAVIVGLVTTPEARYTATRTINIVFDSVTSPGRKTDASQPTVDPLSLARRAEAGREEAGVADSIGVTVAGDQTAGSLTITVTAESEDAALDALDSMTAATNALVIAEISEPVRTRLTASEARLKTLEERVAALDARIDDALAAGQQIGSSNSLTLQRMTAADEAATAAMDVELAKSQLDTFANRMLTATGPTVEPTSSSIVVPVALAVAGALVAFAALLVLQAVDGRIRRRVHVERDVPRAQVLGVLTKGSPADQVSVLERTLTRFVAGSATDEVQLVDLTGGDTSQLARQLDSALEVDVRAVDPATAAASFGEDGTAIIFVVPFGKVSQDRLQAAVADATTSGSTCIAVILTNVPAHDHSWAAVSIH